MQEGEKILQLCIKFGIFVPHLCYLKDHMPLGRCGMCVVEVDNQKMALACTLAAKNGLNIKTDSEFVKKLRKKNLQKILTNHNTECFHCFKAGNCKLQRYIYTLFSSDLNNVESFVKINPSTPKQLTKNIMFNSDKCVKCNRCVVFLNETCNIKCKNIEDFVQEDQHEFSANILDICPTAALFENGTKMFPDKNAQDVITYNANSIFMYPLKVTVSNNKITKIASLKKNWIENKARFTTQNEDYLTHTPEQIANILEHHYDKINIILIGKTIDIETFFIIKYIEFHNKNCIVAFHDLNNCSDFSNIGLKNVDLQSIQNAAFIGISDIEKFYLFHKLPMLKNAQFFNSAEEAVACKLQGWHTFIKHNQYKSCINKPFSILPTYPAHLLANYVVSPTCLSEIVNKNINIICVGETDRFDGIKLQLANFLEYSAYYIDVFGCVIKTEQAVITNKPSPISFFKQVIKLISMDYAQAMENIYANIESAIHIH